MSEAIVAKRYAGALFQIGQEKGTLDHMEAELRVIEEVLQENNTLLPFLQHPGVEKAKKKQLMSDILSQVLPDVRNTLLLLVDRNRAELISDFVEQFINMMNEEKGIAEAVVYSVIPLSEEELNELSSVFAKKLNKNKLIINNVVDESILGGVKLRIGNTIYDGTLSGKLERIERNITSAK